MGILLWGGSLGNNLRDVLVVQGLEQHLQALSWGLAGKRQWILSHWEKMPPSPCPSPLPGVSKSLLLPPSRPPSSGQG